MSDVASRRRKLITRVSIGVALLIVVFTAFAVELHLSRSHGAHALVAMLCSTGVLAALAAAGTYEFCRLLRALGIESHPRWCALGAFLHLAALLPWPGLDGIAVAGVVLALFILAPLARAVFVDVGPGAGRAAAGDAAALFLVAFLIGHLVRIRVELPEGLSLLLAVVLATKSSDIFAYLTGFAVGKHKAIPRISPAKTWEGYAGGLVASLAVGFTLLHLHPLGGAAVLDGTSAAMAAALIALIAPVGDLMESLVKRAAALKDSGSVLPEFGGVLDVLDSLLAVAPIAYLTLALFT